MIIAHGKKPVIFTTRVLVLNIKFWSKPGGVSVTLCTSVPEHISAF